MSGETVVAPRATLWWVVASTALLGAALLAGAMIGPAGPTWWRVPLEMVDRLPLVSVDSGVSEIDWNIVWQIRLPRVVLAGLVGAVLAVAGASYQGVFRNPLVDPYLLGVAAGAGLGATLAGTVTAPRLDRLGLALEGRADAAAAPL